MHEAGYCPKDEKIKKAILHIQPNGHKTYVLKDMSEEIDLMLEAGPPSGRALPILID